MGLEDELGLIELTLEERNIGALVIAERLTLNLPGGVKLRLSRGERLEAPAWLVRLLELEGAVKQEEPDIGITDIARAHYEETHKKTSKELARLPENFYSRVRDYLQKLDMALRASPTPALLEEKAKARAFMEEVIDRRLSAIALVAVSGRGEEALLGKLSPEEEALYKWVKGKVLVWRERVIGPSG